MNSYNKKINIVLTYFFLLVYSLPSSGSLFTNFLSLINYIQYAGFAMAVIVFLTQRVYRQRRLYPIWLFIIIALFATVINDTDMNTCIKLTYPIFSVCVLTYYLIRLKGWNALEMITTMYSIFLILQGITALMGGIGIVVNGNGNAYPDYFMGQRVTINHILVYTLSLCLLAYCNTGRKKKILYIAAILSGIYFVFYEAVSTAIVTVFVLFAVIIVSRILKSEHVWRNLLILLFAFSAVFVLSGGMTNGFEWLLDGILNEGMTLDGRTLVWEQGLQNMEGWHWILGNGYGHSYVFWIGTWKTGLLHSQYMNFLFNFGYIGVAVLFYMYYKQIRVAREVKDSHYRQLIIAANAAIIVTGIPTATFRNVYMYTFFVLLMYFKWMLSTGEK